MLPILLAMVGTDSLSEERSFIGWRGEKKMPSKGEGKRW
jgi:hypothetical protein